MIVDPMNSQIRAKLSLLHENLGHPCLPAMLKLLKDAGADQNTVKVAREFECEVCLTHGRRTVERPSCVSPVTNKWHTINLNTCWWKTPHKQANGKDATEHVLGLSYFDQGSDLHVAGLVRVSCKPITDNVTTEDFKKQFCKDC